MGNLYIEVGKSFQSNSDRWYQTLEFLGNGANAYVYKCICTSLNNEYTGLEFALKIQYNLSTEKRRKRFFEESNFLKQNDHPAIIGHFDTGVFLDSPGYPFMITSYMPMTLHKRMVQGEIAFSDKVKYSCQLLSAVSYLGRKHILHRDIKPSNIFISDDHAYLGDFGIAKSLDIAEDAQDEDDIALLTETALGTTETLNGYTIMPKKYRTPELVRYANREDSLHLESDVFQLGLVLTELFTGKNPLKPSFKRNDRIELEKIGHIDCPSDGGLIFTALQGMLELDFTKRKSAEEVLSIFMELNKRLHLPNRDKSSAAYPISTYPLGDIAHILQ